MAAFRRSLLAFSLAVTASATNLDALADTTLADNRAVALMPKGRGLAAVQYTFESDSKVDTDAIADPPSIGVQMFDVLAGAPIIVRPKYAILVHANYAFHRFEISGTGFDDTEYAHWLALRFSYSQSLAEAWAMTLTFQPAIASDLEEFDGEDFVPNGNAIFAWSFAESHALLFGAGLSKDFGDLLPYPIIGYGFDGRGGSGSGFSIEALVPALAKFNYAFSPAASVFLKATYGGRAWHIHSDTEPDRFVKYLAARVGAGATFALPSGLTFDLFGGAQPLRKFTLEDGTGGRQNENLKPGGFIDAQVSFQPPRPAE